MKKCRLQQVTRIKKSTGHICFTEISLLKVTVFKVHVFQLQPRKERELNHAVLKSKLKQKFSAITELNSKQFTVQKFHFLQTGIFQFDQACIATIKGATDKCSTRKINAVEITVDKLALLIAPVRKCIFPEINFVKSPVVCETGIHALKKFSLIFPRNRCLYDFNKRHVKRFAWSELLEAIVESKRIVHFIMLKNIQSAIEQNFPSIFGLDMSGMNCAGSIKLPSRAY